MKFTDFFDIGFHLGAGLLAGGAFAFYVIRLISAVVELISSWLWRLIGKKGAAS